MIRYIADMHFDHENIIAYDNRPFKNAQEMNEVMIRRWNQVVDDEDLTYILGDFCGGNEARWLELLDILRGRKYLILGNHDPEPTPAVRARLEGVESYLETEDEGRHVVLCHYPIPCFHGQYFGWIHLYGHVHISFEFNMMERDKRLIRDLYPGRDACRMYNVGAMMPGMDYTPRTLEEILQAEQTH